MARLERMQVELLSVLAEAASTQEDTERREFVAIRSMAGDSIRHPSLPDGLMTEFHWPDLTILADYGLLHVVGRRTNTNMFFEVSPEGFEYWETHMAEVGAPVERLQASVGAYVDGEAFRRRFPEAHEKWARATELLWGAEGTHGHTQIGHLCREAMQAFASEFAQLVGVDDSGEPAKTVDRVRRAVDDLADGVPTALADFLKALLPLWGTVSDLVQRQEHGAGKEGDPLDWEDSRLVVFQTAVVMFELDHAFSRSRRSTGG